MNRANKLNRIVRKSFRRLNRLQSWGAFVMHLKLVELARAEQERVREMQFTAMREQSRKEYCSI